MDSQPPKLPLEWDDPVQCHQRKLIKAATYASVMVAIILVAAKIYAWRVTGSMSLQASLMDSLLDMVASALNFVVVRQALKPADREHRFGHGKAESLASLAQSTFIAGSAIWLSFDLLDHLLHPHPLKAEGTGSIVMVVAIGLTLGLVLFQRYVVQKTRSLAIKADAVHYQSDLLTNIGVLISLNVTTYLGWDLLDPIIGALIAAYILYTAGEIALHALGDLMDRELPDDVRQQILILANDHPEVLGVHDLRTRSAGRHFFIQLHLELPPTISLKEAHVISDAVEERLTQAFPLSEVIIHQDPQVIGKYPI